MLWYWHHIISFVLLDWDTVMSILIRDIFHFLGASKWEVVPVFSLISHMVVDNHSWTTHPKIVSFSTWYVCSVEIEIQQLRRYYHLKATLNNCPIINIEKWCHVDKKIFLHLLSVILTSILTMWLRLSYLGGDSPSILFLKLMVTRKYRNFSIQGRDCVEIISIGGEILNSFVKKG